MDIIIDQQFALDEALVPHASRPRIGKSKFRLRSDIKSKESTLQVVYDVLKLTSFYKAFLVTADVPEIYMQEFWATATVHHHSIRFKMNNKKLTSIAVSLKAKTKYKKKTDEPITSPKSKTASASKEAEQTKLATKRSKKDFHISHTSGSGDGFDTQSKVPDKQEQNTSDTDEGTGK
nr:hypothetical protein [Tanacetum cinerariifolium]